ncbi:hypothetical protein TYM08_P3102 [Marinicellulosiphila megalodicopiae]
MGQNVRYDGKHNLVDHPALKLLQLDKRIVLACPEMLGGLPTPRAPAEIIHTDKQQFVRTQSNIDVTEAFITGAKLTLELCLKHNIGIALMAKNSPSCGNEQTYDGTFSKTLIKQAGVTASLLQSNHIQIFNQTQIEEFLAALN